MDAVSIASQKYVEQQLNMRNVASLDMLPKEVRREIRKEAKAIALRDVFGADHKRDKDGNPVEQGIGSPVNMTQSAIDAYISNQTDRRRRGDEKAEDGYQETLAKMRKQLAECNTRRQAQRAADDDDD